MPKNSKNTKEIEAAEEKARQEHEELKQRLSAETEADMIVLRALLDVERQAKGIEQAAEDYAVGSEWRVSENRSEIDATERAEVRKAAAAAAEEAKAKADKQIAAVRAEMEARRAELSARFESQRAGYVDRVFDLVTGAANE